MIKQSGLLGLLVSSFCLLVISVANSQSTGLQPNDSVAIKNFDGSLYRGSSYNYRIAENSDGILFIGNENGLLEFDGASWQLHQSDNFTPVTNLKIVGDKIYTVGTDEIGYFQRDANGVMQYVSLRQKIKNRDVMRAFFFINEVGGKIYFNSYEHFLIWDGEVLQEIEVGAAHSFKVGNELLISIYGKGLAIPVGDTLKFVNTDLKFEDDAAFNILKNSQGEWILFTSESGFYKLDTTDYSTVPWEGEMNDYFLEDNQYLLAVERWVDSLFIASSYNNGIFIFNEEGKILKRFDGEAGLNTASNNIPLVDRRGNVWLANELGVNYLKWINPKEGLSFEPKTIVRKVRIGDSTIHVKSANQVIKYEGEQVKSISFQYATPSFITEYLEYSYFLEGFDETWSDWNTDIRKEYTNLPGGTFTFQVKARHNYLDEINIAPFYLTVTLPTPWYLNKWNYLMVALLLGVLIVLVIRYRTQNLSKSNKKLERMVRERTNELVSQQEQLKHANSELKTLNAELDNFVYRSSHDLVAPLKSLRGLIQVAQIDSDEKSRLSYFQLMNTSINKLEEFIRSIMDFSTNSKKPLEFKEIRLDELLNSIVDDIKYYENADKIRLIRHYDSDFKIVTDGKRLHIILSNLITNAVKYHNYHKDEELYIKISALLIDNQYQINVEDNGQGIPEEHHNKIFDMFFRAHQGIQGSGLGLYIVADTLNILSGKISFTSKNREGTNFKILLPVPI